MGGIREVKKSFCALSAAYIVLGLVLIFWPDISVKTFCYVFGVGMIIFGGAHLIIYFTKDKLQSVMQMNMVAGIVGIATGVFILIKMEYMLEIIPFALGVVALLGAVVKVQHSFDLKRLGVEKWYLMLAVCGVLFVLGALLVANPFEGMEVIVTLIGIALLVDGIGNLVGIFWIAHAFKTLNKMGSAKETYEVLDVTAEEVKEKNDGKIFNKITLFRGGNQEESAAKEEAQNPIEAETVTVVETETVADETKPEEEI